MGALSREDYEGRKARQAQGLASDDDLRMIKHYEKREGYPCHGSSTQISSDPPLKQDRKNGTPPEQTAQTTERHSKSETASSTAHTTGGRRKA